MRTSEITRRDFLKMVGGFLLAASSGRFLQVFDKKVSNEKKKFTEAKYYSVGRDLAG